MRVELIADRVLVAADMVLKEGAAIEFEANAVSRASAQGDLPSGSRHWLVSPSFEPPPQPKDTATSAAGFSDELRVTMPAGNGTMNRIVMAASPNGEVHADPGSPG